MADDVPLKTVAVYRGHSGEDQNILVAAKVI
jgi:hypothetical protein